jgi:hypothetical protein
MNRHPVDALSAALGVIAIVISVVVLTGSVGSLDNGGGWWIAVLVLLLGAGLVPWRGRRDVDDQATVESAKPAPEAD